jgi:uncharacterized RDD family membrane protein YckC
MEEFDQRREPVLLDVPVAGRSAQDEEASQVPPAPRPRLQQAQAPVDPWRRFFAQLFDIWTLCMPAGFALAMFAARFWPRFALWMSSPTSDAGLGFILVPLALLVQAIVFGLFGTTPGKLILGIRVTNSDGSRPTFAQYLRRMLGLWWYGLGLGVPFVTLFTMGRQYTNLKAGRQASYDRGRFRIEASPMGAFRTLTAVVALFALFLAVGYFHEIDQRVKARYFSGFEWTNPRTGAVASVPGGWVASEQQNDAGDTIHTFSSDRERVVAVFAMEETAASVTLEQYQKMWSSAVRQVMAMDTRATPVNAVGRYGLQLRGVMASDPRRQVQVTFVKSGRQVWRLVLVGTPGTEPDSGATQKLRNVLIQTLKMQESGSGGQAV